MAVNTLTQQLSALALANETRTTIAEFRRDVRAAGTKEACWMVSGVIENDYHDRVFGAVKIGHLLRAVPAFGEQKVAWILRGADVISADKRLRTLTERQRDEVVAGVDVALRMWLSNRARVESRRRGR